MPPTTILRRRAPARRRPSCCPPRAPGRRRPTGRRATADPLSLVKASRSLFPPGGLRRPAGPATGRRGCRSCSASRLSSRTRPGAGGNIGADLGRQGNARWLHLDGGIDRHRWRSASSSMPACRMRRRSAFAPTSLLVNTPKVIAVGALQALEDARRAHRRGEGGARALSAGSAGKAQPAYRARLFSGRRRRSRPRALSRAGVGADRWRPAARLIIDNVPNILPQLRDGAARPLAVATPAGCRSCRRCRPLAEPGLPGFLFGTMVRLAAPAGTSCCHLLV